MFRFVLSFLLSAMLCGGMAQPASAQGFPALYSVVDVASDDVLNIRAEPTGKAPIIGEFAYDQTGVEVIKLNEAGTWGLVNTAERSGWAYMRYLVPIAGGSAPDWDNLECFGTEPFWNMAMMQGQRAETSIMGHEMDFAITRLIKASGRPWPWAVQGRGDAGEMTAVITPEYCDDGMSDREYGMSISMVLSAQDILHYSGCCVLSTINWLR